MCSKRDNLEKVFFLASGNFFIIVNDKGHTILYVSGSDVYNKEAMYMSCCVLNAMFSLSQRDVSMKLIIYRQILHDINIIAHMHPMILLARVF